MATHDRFAVPAGGRARARQFAIVGVLLVALGVRPAPATASTPQVSVQEARGVYTVAASFRVAQPAPVVAAVLTDYDAIPRFMPDVQKSVVLERPAHGRVIVRQEATARVFMFSKQVYLELEIDEAPGQIQFRDRSRRTFVRYEGAWRLAPDDHGHVVVHYQLTAIPSFDVPEFLLKRLLKRDAGRMMEALRAEMAARAISDQQISDHS